MSYGEIGNFVYLFDKLSKIKVFELLVQNNYMMPITQISKAMGYNHSNLSKVLKEMERVRLIDILKYGRIKMISINDNSIHARRFKIFLELYHDNEPFVLKRPEVFN